MSRKIDVKDIKNIIKELSVKANTVLRPDVKEALNKLYKSEKNGSPAQKMLKVLIENADIAEKEKMPICQDTGMLAVFIELGEEVELVGGSLKNAINKAVEEAYVENNFRKSVVSDPILRKNTETNTPAVIHTDIVGGDKVFISVMPKGFGSENKSQLAMLNPTCGMQEVVRFCVEAVKKAGPDACPPYVLGIGLGGTMDECALLSKKALLRPITKHNPKKHIKEMEELIKKESNALNIGIMGLGGETTVMGVNIEEGPTHIAGCPVALNISCHALRSASAII